MGSQYNGTYYSDYEILSKALRLCSSWGIEKKQSLLGIGFAITNRETSNYFEFSEVLWKSFTALL